MAIVWRVLAAIGAINFIVLFIFVSIATLQFDSILSGLIQERLVVIADRVRVPFAAVTDLGLPLSTVRNAQAILEDARQDDSNIQHIHVFEQDGAIVHSTSNTPPNDLSKVWAEGLDGKRIEEGFRVETEDAFIVAATITSPAQEMSGGVVIVYSKDLARTQVLATAASLGFAAGLVLAVMLLVGWGVLRIALSEHVRVFAGILATYDRFERQFWRSSMEEEHEDDAAVSGLGVSTATFGSLLKESESQYNNRRDRTSL
jgi:hypothetical protein